MRADKTIPRPAIRYFGGKWRLAPWIVSHFPEHRTYVEPCGGAASVLLQKPRSHRETYNDLDENVVNYFKVLRERSDELVRALELTPWARVEYERHHEPTDDPVERARRFWIGSNMAISGTAFTSSGIRMLIKDEAHGSDFSMQCSDPTYLYQIARRFKGVQIENRPFEEVALYYDSPVNLIYFDPPYVGETRTSGQYKHEFDDALHVQAAELLLEARSFVVVSGYPSELYFELYESRGFKRIDRKANGNNGSKRIESLWLSPRTWSALAEERTSRQTSLFGAGTL